MISVLGRRLPPEPLPRGRMANPEETPMLNRPTFPTPKTPQEVSLPSDCAQTIWLPFHLAASPPPVLVLLRPLLKPPWNGMLCSQDWSKDVAMVFDKTPLKCFASWILVMGFAGHSIRGTKTSKVITSRNVPAKYQSDSGQGRKLDNPETNNS